MDETFNWHRVPGCSALQNEVAGCSALLKLLDVVEGGLALAELLDAAEDMKRFMAT